MSQITIDTDQLKELVMDSLAEILKSGDETVTDIYEDILLGKIMENSPSTEYVDAETFKKVLNNRINAL